MISEANKEKHGMFFLNAIGHVSEIVFIIFSFSPSEKISHSLFMIHLMSIYGIVPVSPRHYSCPEGYEQ